MKITKSELKQIIKEELQQSLDENPLALSEEEELLNEHPVVMAALKNPAVQKMLINMLMPMIQKAMSGAAAPAAAPAAE